MIRLARLWHTARWLRPVQVYARVARKLRRVRPDLRAAPSPCAPKQAWRACARAASMLGPDTFRFLNVEHRINDPADWNHTDWPKLWLYNAHYFDDLVADGVDERCDWHRALIARWIAQNPPAHGNGWEPYPTSLRAVNWIKWTLSGDTPDARMLDSLAAQVRWLRAHLETHLLGNHLWANAKALVFAGAFFEGAEAAAWLAQGMALVRRELAEQILPDGGHFELSPMYHAIVLEDVLDLIQLADIFPGTFDAADTATWRATATRMLHWLGVMTHPDGEIAFFNDAAFGIAPNLAALQAYASSIGVDVSTKPLAAIEALPDSGYVRLTAGDAVLIADVARIGPDYIPGHAHADTLSFELSLRGQRVLVNGGTSTYEPDAERLRQRGTAAHNTVTVDGKDSSEVWAAFRVARRARPRDVHWGHEGDTLWLEGAHDGYRRSLPHGPLHHRRWELHVDGLRVTDTLDGRFAGAVARFRFPPGSSDMLQWSCDDAAMQLQSDAWHPRFGISEACRVLEVTFRGATVTSEFRWTAGSRLSD